MFHLECSNDRRRIILPVVILKPEPVTDLDGYKAMALLDTGATTTGITPRVIDALGLLSFGKRPLGSAQGDGQADRYLFRIGLMQPPQLAKERVHSPMCSTPLWVSV